MTQPTVLTDALASAPLTGADDLRPVALALSALNESARNLDRDIAERLRASREQALGRRKASRVAQRATDAPGLAARPLGWASGAAPLPDRRASEGLNPFTGAASLLPLVVLVVGLAILSHTTAQWRASELAELDTQLLTAELPPAAYTDSGFVEFLRATHADAAAAADTTARTEASSSPSNTDPALAGSSESAKQVPGS